MYRVTFLGLKAQTQRDVQVYVPGAQVSGPTGRTVYVPGAEGLGPTGRIALRSSN
jgi:hypothetical protein